MLQRSEAKRGMKVAPPTIKAGLTRQIGKLQSAGVRGQASCVAVLPRER
jgi:hypothetical protein